MSSSKIALIFILSGIVVANATAQQCDRGWLLEKVYTGFHNTQAEESRCMLSPQNTSSQFISYVEELRKNCTTYEDLAAQLKNKKNWREEMRVLWYNRDDGSTWSTLITTTINQYGNWEVNNANLDGEMATECDAWFDPTTGKTTIIDTVSVFKVERFNVSMAEKSWPIETPMHPGRGSHGTDGKQDLSTL